MHGDVPTLVHYCVRAVSRRLRNQAEPDRKLLILTTKRSDNLYTSSFDIAQLSCSIEHRAGAGCPDLARMEQTQVNKPGLVTPRQFLTSLLQSFGMQACYTRLLGPAA